MLMFLISGIRWNSRKIDNSWKKRTKGNVIFVNFPFERRITFYSFEKLFLCNKMSDLTLHYWGIKGRNYTPVVVAQAGGVSLNQNVNPDLAELKATILPFGQLPCLVDGDVVVAQSGAVIRYLAHKGGLDGRDNLADFGRSEMLIEEMQDINSIFNKTQYPSEGKRSAAWDALFNAEDSALLKQLGLLEKLLTGDYFCSRPLAGDYSVACILDLAVTLEPTVLANFPKLAAFHARMVALPAFDGIKDYNMYFSRAD